MASKYYGDLCYSNGEYTDNEGQTRKRWNKAGAVFQQDDGRLSIKFEAMPVGEWSGWMNIFQNGNSSGKPNSSKPMTQAQALNGGKDVAIEDIDDTPIDLDNLIPF